MRKEDLKTGMLVQLRNGEVKAIIGDYYYAYKSYNNLSWFRDDLTNKDINDYDIIRVSSVITGYDLKPENWTEETLNNNLLWEREEVPEYVEIILENTFFNKKDIHKVKESVHESYKLYTHEENDYWFLNKTFCKPSTKEAYEAQFKENVLTIEEIEKLTGLKNIKIKK